MESSCSTRPRHARRVASVAAAGLALVLALASCTGETGSTASTTQTGGTLTVGVGADVGKFDPAFSNMPTYDQFAYATPVYQTSSGDFEPYLAKSWKFAADNKSVTLNLRPDAKFSDGTQVTAAAVADSMNRFRSTVSAKQFQARQVGSVSPAGDLDVTITFVDAVPQSYALTLLSQGSAFAMVTAPSSTANPASMNLATNGAGPYKLDPDKSTVGSEYTFVANENYFAPEARTYETIVIRAYADPTSLANAVTTGQVTYAVSILTSAATSAKNAGLTVSKGAAGIGDSGTATLVLGKRSSGPLSDIRVRQAIAYAMPRTDIKSSLYDGWSTPASSVTPEGMTGHTGKDPFAYDVAKAKKLLADAGYPNGFPLTITSPSAYDPGNLIGQSVQGALEKIGITVNLEQNQDDFSTIGSKVLAGKFDAYIYTEPGEDIYSTVTNSMTGPSFLNPSGEALPADLARQLTAATSASADQQKAELEKLTELVDNQVWFVTLQSIPRLTTVASGVKNVPVTYVSTEPSPTSPNAGKSWWGQ